MAKKLTIATILFSVLLAVSALFHPGLLPTHDGEYHVIRFYEFDKAVRDGDLYPRWAADLNFGYGVPLFNYVYPLPNYVATFLHFFNMSFIDAFKWNMIIATFLGAIFMYAWAKMFWGKWGGIVSSVFYTYAPYHLLDIYIRGSVGEVWALALFPAFLWSITKLIQEKRAIFLPISSLILSLIIFSHNILALMFFPFALSYIGLLIYSLKKDRRIAFQKSVFATFLALTASAIFWLPALFEKKFVRGLEIYDFRQHFVEIYQVVFPSWGSGFSADSAGQGLSFQIGIANLIVIGICVFILIFRNVNKLHIIFMFFWIFAALFLMLPPSLFLWEGIPLLSYFQFPWRLLSLVILCCSFLAGAIPNFWRNKVLLIALLLLPILLGVGYAKVPYYHQRDDMYYTNRSNFIDGTNSPGNAFNTLWASDITERKKEKLEFIEGEGNITTEYIKTSDYKFTVSSKQDGKIMVNTMYFPGWTVFIDGKATDASLYENGTMMFPIVKGEHIVELRLQDTPIRSFSVVLSLAAWIIVGFLSVTSLRGRISR